MVDLITQCYQQMHMLAANQRNDQKRLLRAFQMGLDLQELFRSACISRKRCKKAGGTQPCRSGDPLERADRRRRLRVLADDMLYHRFPKRFQMDKQIEALEKIARQHPDNPVGHFCAWHFSRIARCCMTQRPLYAGT